MATEGETQGTVGRVDAVVAGEERPEERRSHVWAEKSAVGRGARAVVGEERDQDKWFSLVGQALAVDSEKKDKRCEGVKESDVEEVGDTGVDVADALLSHEVAGSVRIAVRVVRAGCRVRLVHSQEGVSARTPGVHGLSDVVVEIRCACLARTQPERNVARGEVADEDTDTLLLNCADGVDCILIPASVGMNLVGNVAHHARLIRPAHGEVAAWIALRALVGLEALGSLHGAHNVQRRAQAEGSVLCRRVDALRGEHVELVLARMREETSASSNLEVLEVRPARPLELFQIARHTAHHSRNLCAGGNELSFGNKADGGSKELPLNVGQAAVELHAATAEVAASAVERGEGDVVGGRSKAEQERCLVAIGIGYVRACD